jgi:small subunit ribosomal protein MRP21
MFALRPLARASSSRIYTSLLFSRYNSTTPNTQTAPTASQTIPATQSDSPTSLPSSATDSLSQSLDSRWASFAQSTRRKGRRAADVSDLRFENGIPVPPPNDEDWWINISKSRGGEVGTRYDGRSFAVNAASPLSTATRKLRAVMSATGFLRDTRLQMTYEQPSYKRQRLRSERHRRRFAANVREPFSVLFFVVFGQ